jgi:aminoglycoside phosphotransferase (APT) family kinase protein
MPGHLIPRCYDAVHSKNTGRSHMLFENLASTHFLTPFPLAPSNYYCKRIVEDLAEIHSFWWEKSDLKEEANNTLNAIEFKNVFNNNIDNYQKWAHFLGDNLSPQRKELYNKVILTFPKVWETERILKRKRYTLIHNDAHPWNIFLPYQEDKDSVKFFDWSFWKIGVGVDDLAYFMALHWYPERRKHMEKSLLQSYYNKLIENGVKDYQWEECWDDYRLSVIDNLFTPIWQHSNNVPAYIWWHHLERIISAFQDLKCIELL